jgi:hypothetical protein
MNRATDHPAAQTIARKGLTRPEAAGSPHLEVRFIVSFYSVLARMRLFVLVAS